ncbi:MAG: heme exporter protein CcmD [Myxococcota bacterium]
MSYVIAAFGVTAVTLVAYWLHLMRERRALRRG